MDTRKLQVSVHTTWWNRDDQKFGFYRAWPHKDDVDAMQSYNNLLNRVSRSKSRVPRVATVSLHKALTHHSKCSAYLVSYKPTKIPVRLSTTMFNPNRHDFLSLFHEVCPDGIQMQLAIFDMDCHGGGNVDAWFDAQRPKLATLLEDHPGLIVWRSNGGMRLLGILPEPFSIKSKEDCCQWTRTMTAWINYLARRYDLKTEGGETADVLADWSRYQRVPHDTRVKGQPSADLEIIGNVEDVGLWQPDLIETDWPAAYIPTNDQHLDYHGECQLLSLIQNAGLRNEQVGPGEWDIECPNRLNHGDVEDRFSKTRLYTNGPIGKIDCKSSSCRSAHPDRCRDYLRHFNAGDILATSPWDWSKYPEVQAVIDKRAALQDGATLETWEAGLPDTSYQELVMAIQAAGTTQRERKSRTTAVYAEFAEWFVDQNIYESPNETAFQAFLTGKRN